MSSEQAFKGLCRTADKDLVRVWEEQEAVAISRRDMHPESMDIYDIKVQKGLRHQHCLIMVTD